FNCSPLTIFGIYRHPNVPVSRVIVDSLFSFIDTQGPVLLLGDFNAYHPSWGFSRSSPIFLSHPLRSPSTIDLIFASPDFAPVCNVLVIQDLFGSDHFPIEVDLNCLVRSSNIFSHRIRLILEQ
ncbi:hypothetical protein ALC60_12156, partial [Trachymyrmex zeteki]